MKESEISHLLELAEEAKGHAYAPYSKFRVGACLLTESGKTYQGCNIENAGYTPTNCAERTAMFQAIYDGERAFRALAIQWDGEGYAMPCGVCRQVLIEFCSPDMPIYCGKKEGGYRMQTLGQLLPGAFTPKDLGK